MGDNPYLKSGVSSCFSSYMISGKFSFGTLPDSDLTLGAQPKKYCRPRPSAYLAYYCSIKAKLANFQAQAYRMLCPTGKHTFKGIYHRLHIRCRLSIGLRYKLRLAHTADDFCRNIKIIVIIKITVSYFRLLFIFCKNRLIMQKASKKCHNSFCLLLIIRLIDRLQGQISE